MGSAQAPKSLNKQIAKWARRGTAIALYALLVTVMFDDRVTLIGTWNSAKQSVSVLGDLLPPAKVIGLIGFLWWLYLSQMNVLWFIWVPFYLLFYPPYAFSVAITSRTWSVIQRLYNSHANAKQVERPTSKKKTAVPFRRIWLATVVISFLFLDQNEAWTRWLVTFLVVPVWVWSLRIAYANTVSPTTFAEALFEFANATLAGCKSEVDDARKKEKKEAPISRLACNFASFVLRRYPSDRAMTVIQRETLLTFSFCLVLAFSASCILWGLVAFAIIGNDPTFFGAYSYFNSSSFTECLTWAFGCMTTTIEYPGQAATVAVKLIHTLVLLMGLFHLTYLFLGFSVMASAETQRTVTRTARDYDGLLAARDHLELQLTLLADSQSPVDVSTTPPGANEQATESRPQ